MSDHLPVRRTRRLSVAHVRRPKLHRWRLLAASGLLVLILAAAPPARAQGASVGAAATPLGPNLLQNGDFSREAVGWTLERTRGGAEATLEHPPDRPPSRVIGKVVRVNVRALGSEPWHVQLYQSGLTLEEGQPYTLACWARADRERPLSVAANIDYEDGHGIGLAAERLTLTRNWRKLTLAFTVVRPVPAHNRLTFILGAAVGSVDLAGVTLRRGVPGQPTGGSVLRNGDFTLGGERWVLEQGSGDSAAAMELADAPVPAGVPGRLARIRVEKLGQERWHVQLVQGGLDLKEGEPYVLTFWARADRPRPLTLDTTLDMPDWHSIGFAIPERLEATWQRFTVAFTPTRTVADHGRISFVLGEATGTVELAGVSLVRQETPSQAAHPLIGAWESRAGPATPRYAFTFNADGTGTLRTGTAPAAQGAPRAPAANPFRWYVGDDAQEVVIASRAYSWTISRGTDEDRLVLKGPGGKEYRLFRRR